MAVDFNAVAQAIAARFSAANVTAPSGETTVRFASEQLPQQIGPTPAVLVYPPEVELHYGPSTRSGSLTFPVRWYVYRVKDQPRNATLILKWLGSLYAQLEAQVHLGLSDYVAYGVISALTPGQLSYGGEDFEGIELTVTVPVYEALNPTA